MSYGEGKQFAMEYGDIPFFETSIYDDPYKLRMAQHEVYVIGYIRMANQESWSRFPELCIGINTAIFVHE